MPTFRSNSNENGDETDDIIINSTSVGGWGGILGKTTAGGGGEEFGFDDDELENPITSFHYPQESAATAAAGGGGTTTTAVSNGNVGDVGADASMFVIDGLLPEMESARAEARKRQQQQDDDDTASVLEQIDDALSEFDEEEQQQQEDTSALLTLNGGGGEEEEEKKESVASSPSKKKTHHRPMTPNKNSNRSGGKLPSMPPAPPPPPLPMSLSSSSSQADGSMFCGECTSTAPPPPPSMMKSFKSSKSKSPLWKSRKGGQQKQKQRRKRRGRYLGLPGTSSGDYDIDTNDVPSADHINNNNHNNPDDHDDDGIELGIPKKTTTTRPKKQPSPSSDSESSTTESSSSIMSMQRRSYIHVENLTCPSQILVLNSVIVRPIKGVTKLTTDLSNPNIHDSRLVRIDHDPLIASASSICAAMQNLGYICQIEKDGGRDLMMDDDPHALCRSTLSVEGVCCPMEVPAVQSILYEAGSVIGLSSTNDEYNDKGSSTTTKKRKKKKKTNKSFNGVRSVNVNIMGRIIYVDHDPFVISATKLATTLTNEGFPSKVRRDGGKSIPQKKKSSTESSSLSTPSLVRTALDVVATSDKEEKQWDVSLLRQTLSGVRGVRRIGINKKERCILVDHVPNSDLPNHIRKALSDCDAGLECTIRSTIVPPSSNDQKNDDNNNSDDIMTAASAVVSSTPTVRNSRYVESTLFLPSLSNLSDVRKLQQFLRKRYVEAHMRAFYPHIPSKTLKIEHDPSLAPAASIAFYLSETLGFDGATVAVDGDIEGLILPLEEEYADEEREQRRSTGHDRGIRSNDMGDEDENGLPPSSTLFAWKGQVQLNVVLSGLFWLISMLSYIPGWESFKYAGLFSVMLGLPPVAKKAYRTLRRYQFDSNCMMMVAALGAVALQEYDEAASVAFLFAVSEWLEARATAKARRALGAIVSLRPEHANVVDGTTGRILLMPASSVAVGSTVSVRTGDKVPTDGVIIEGSSTLDESSLTGEARPIPKTVDDVVSGGSINIGLSRLLVRTTSTVDDSAVSRLIRLVEEAQANRSPTEQIVDAFAKRYTPAVLVLAAIMCTVPWYFGLESGRRWTLNGLIIIVIACPCALTISTPVTYAAGLAAAAHRGVIIKGGARLEALGRVKKIVFDKTGTLTEGKFRLLHLTTVGERKNRKQVLELLALMEAPSSHPISAAILNAAKNEHVEIPKNVALTAHTVLKGEGITAIVDGQNVCVGNTKLFQRLGMYHELDPVHKANAERWNAEGGTVGFVGVEAMGIVGMFCVADAVREEAKHVVRELHQVENMDIVMLTGDGDGAAKAVGREIGLSDANIHSHLLPEEKLHFIASLKKASSGNDRNDIRRNLCGSKHGKDFVLMCGDGANDAPALAVADVGVAMGEGAALAMEMSDVTLMDSNLTKLLFSIRMGSKVISTIRENIAFSILAKLTVVLFTFMGKTTLLAAIASDVGVMLAVTLNGMKLLPTGNLMMESSTTTATTMGSSEPIPKKGRGRAAGGVKYDDLPIDGSSDDIPDII